MAEVRCSSLLTVIRRFLKCILGRARIRLSSIARRKVASESGWALSTEFGLKTTSIRAALAAPRPSAIQIFSQRNRTSMWKRYKSGLLILRFDSMTIRFNCPKTILKA